jgi:hypothetical protein
LKEAGERRLRLDQLRRAGTQGKPIAGAELSMALPWLRTLEWICTAEALRGCRLLTITSGGARVNLSI